MAACSFRGIRKHSTSGARCAGSRGLKVQIYLLVNLRRGDTPPLCHSTSILKELFDSTQTVSPMNRPPNRVESGSNRVETCGQLAYFARLCTITIFTLW